MGKCFLHGNGGADSLNFKIVGGTEQPQNPRENTIWIQTDTNISEWSFAPSAPQTAKNGAVVIITGSSGAVGFNALRRNGIQLYPLSAKQYVSGSWVTKTMKIYQGGSWAESILYLHKAGDPCVTATGGWQAIPILKSSQNPLTAEAPSVTTANGMTKISENRRWKNGAYVTKNKVSLNGYHTITAKVSGIQIGDSSVSCWMGLYSSIGSYSTENVLAGAIIESNSTEIKLTIPDNAGMCYVAFIMTSGENASYISLSELKCE